MVFMKSLDIPQENENQKSHHEVKTKIYRKVRSSLHLKVKKLKQVICCVIVRFTCLQIWHLCFSLGLFLKHIGTASTTATSTHYLAISKSIRAITAAISTV